MKNNHWQHIGLGYSHAGDKLASIVEIVIAELEAAKAYASELEKNASRWRMLTQEWHGDEMDSVNAICAAQEKAKTAKSKA